MGELFIRDAVMSDLDELVRMRMAFQRHMEASNPRVWRITEDGQARLREETEGMLVKNGGRMIVAGKDGCIVGLAYEEVYRRTTYIRYIVEPLTYLI